MTSSAREADTFRHSGGLLGVYLGIPPYLIFVMFEGYHGGPSWSPPCPISVMLEWFHRGHRLVPHGAEGQQLSCSILVDALSNLKTSAL